MILLFIFTLYTHTLYLIGFVVLMDSPTGTLSTDTSMMDSDDARRQLHANESDDSL